MKNRLEIFLFIDALGWKIANAHKFMESELPHRKPLGMQFGYSCSAIPTLLSGKTPSEHGHLSLFRFDPENSPFKIFSRLAFLFKPDSFWSRGRVRNWLSKIVKKVYGFTGYFQLYAMPIKKLSLMDYSEKRDLFAKSGMSPLENLYDMLEKTGVAFHISDWHKSDAENFAAAESAIKGGARFLFVYTAELDALLHEHVGDFKTVEKKLAAYAEKIRSLLGVCKAQCPKFRLTVVSDHGMTPLKKTVDAMSAIEKTGLVFGRDYGACYDSTMARFTYISDCAKGTIERAMSAFGDCGHFLSEDDQRRYGVYRADGFFGDAIFLFEAGIQISPSDMGVKPLNGMHGYAPEDSDSVASILSTDPLPENVETLADVFAMMKRAASELAEK